jgi:hypothetical protein
MSTSINLYKNCSHFKHLIWNFFSNWKQTLQVWCLGGPLQVLLILSWSCLKHGYHIGTLQRNEAQLTDKYRIMAVLKVEMDIIISITASPNDTHMMKISIFWGRKASFDMCWSTRKDMYCLRHNHARPMSVVANENNVTLFREVYIVKCECLQ